MKKASVAAIERARASIDRRLTPTECAIIAYVCERGDRPCTKEQMALKINKSTKTIDRLVSRLRKDGILGVEYRWDDRGGQLANVYRLQL